MAEKENVDKAIDKDAGCVDAWAYLFQSIRESASEDEAIAIFEQTLGRPGPAEQEPRASADQFEGFRAPTGERSTPF